MSIDLCVLGLGYIGLKAPSPLFTLMGRVFSVVYFAFFVLMPWYTKIDPVKPVPERVTYDHH